jgi:hypothetical protein
MPDRARVTVLIAGGLGNQLFQYATARRLALQSDVPLTLDHLSGFPRDFYKRRYLLDRFAIHADTIAPRSSYLSYRARLRRKLQVQINQRRDFADRTYVRERDSRFEPRLLDLRVTRPIYLEGYWQYEPYFRDIRETLCEELTLRGEHDAENLAFAARIRSVEAVCLHVRRLHGVPNSQDARPVMDPTWKHYIDPSYFEKAIALMAQRVANPHFFVFADYPDWAREHIRAPHPLEFVTHNGADRDYEDFWLMSLCRHFIVANSTFSWWAAWLGQDPRKIVIAPKDSIGPDQVLKSAPDSWLLV